MQLLKVSSLKAYYGDFQALFNVSCHVDEGEIVAIIGANGAGKTTFLNAITGIVESREPSILYCGQSICGKKPWEIVKLGISMVPEGRRLFSSLNVEENLLMGAYASKQGSWSLKEIYEIFPRLEQRRLQPSQSLSGGEQQMVAIGRALISNPRLLICDELSLGLAPKIIAEIYERLSAIKSKGITMIVVEQNVRQALAFADRVYCFQEGKVSLEGRASELKPEDVSKAYFGLAGKACTA